MHENVKNRIKEAPKRPGVYLYKNSEGIVLYVGKALSLRDRLYSYTQKVPAKIAEMLTQAHDLAWIETGSDFEAILLEATLIKKYLPHYNTALRDDKSYLYIFISTGEEFPKVLLARKPKNGSRSRRFETFEGAKGEYFGPFTSAQTTRQVLKWLRRIIPFCQQKRMGKRACFYSHIGLCRPCPSNIIKQPEPLFDQLKKQYRQQIFRLKRILEGNIASVATDLEKEMKKLSREERFEEAAQIRTQLRRLKWLSTQTNTKHFLENPNFYADSQKQAIDELVRILRENGVAIEKADKIECFDVSTFQGNFSVASQIVFVNGIPEKNLYRRYRIRLDGKPNDFDMLSESLGRRLKHPEWIFPDLFVIDGGKGQVSSAKKTLAAANIKTPVIGLAKQFEKIIVSKDHEFQEITIPKKSEALQLMQAMRDEAHRFAITYHRKRRAEAFLRKKT